MKHGSQSLVEHLTPQDCEKVLGIYGSFESHYLTQESISTSHIISLLRHSFSSKDDVVVILLSKYISRC